jgi:fatty acid desaturase
MSTTEVRADELTWDEVYPRVSRLLRPNAWASVRYIAQEWAMLVVVLAGAVWALTAWRAGELSTAIFLPVAILATIAVGALQHRLSGLGHEGCHWSLFKNKLVNDLASDFFTMFPTFAITRQFRATHLDHHRFINNPERDPDVKRLHNAVPGAFPKTKGRFLLRYVLASLWLPNLIRYILGQGHNAGPFAKGSKPMKHAYPLWAAVVMLVLFWVVVWGSIAWAGYGRALLLFWFVPLLTSYSFFMQLREIAHHSNAPDGGDLTGSRIFFVHPFLRFAVFPYGQDYHLTHHLFGILPHFRTATVHDLLMQYPPYRDNVVVCRGYFFRTPGTNGPSVLDVLSGPRPAPNRATDHRRMTVRA